MSIQEIRTYKNIQDAIIERAKISDTTTNRNFIKEYINTFYQKIGFKKHYRWSGETRSVVLKAEYTTGTVTVTNGSDVITGVSTAWTEFDHLFAKIKIGSVSTPFKIIRVASTTSATLDAPYTGDSDSGVSYSIYRDEIGMFPDLLNIRKLSIPGIYWGGQPLPCGPDEIDRLRYQSPFQSGNPKKYTLHGMNLYTQKTWATFNWDFDFWEDDFYSVHRNRNLVIWPAILSSDKIAQIRYTRIVPPMGADADEPLIPYETRAILVYGPLMEYFLKGRDINIKREWERMYREYAMEMESDVETTDDELVLHVDRSRNKVNSSLIWHDEDITAE